MKVEVELINERGRIVATKTRATMPRYRGVLKMNEERVQVLGRAVVVAQLVSSTDGTDTPLLPVLHEATVLYMRGAQIRVRGFELVDGVQYGQTWDVKVS